MMFDVVLRAKKSRALLAGLFCFLSGLLQFSAHAQVGTPSLFANWVPSPDPAVVGYHLYYGAATSTYTNVIDAGTSTNVTISGLVPEVTYYFVATAYDAVGAESDFSNEVSATPLPTPLFPGNQPPTMDPISDLTLNENHGPEVIYFTGVSSGATNEVQTLTATATSSNPSLIPVPTVVYGSPGPNGALVLRPATNGYGTAIISVTLDDGGLTNNIVTRSFTVTINHVNRAPTITAIANQNIPAGASTSPLAFTIGDAETMAGSLTMSAASSNPALLPVSKITFGGSNASRTVALAPVAGQSGSATITITVSDGSATASTSFQLVVRGKPVAPSGLTISTL